MNIKITNLYILFFLCFITTQQLSKAQDSVSINTIETDESNALFSYKEPKSYKIVAIDFDGLNYLDKTVVTSLTSLKVGQTITIPGDDVTKCIKNLWNQGLFGDVSVYASKIEGNEISIVIKVEEKPRLNNINFVGIKKGDAQTLMESIESFKARPLTPALKNNIANIVKDFYIEKSYLNTTVDIEETEDVGLKNSASININIDKGNKVKIESVTYLGRENGELAKMRKAMSKTKPMSKISLIDEDVPDYSTKQKIKNTLYTLANLNHISLMDFLGSRFKIAFKGTKFNEDLYKEDKNNLLAYYNKIGYRDAKILEDTVITNPNTGNVNIIIKLEEGNKYYFRDIKFKGNSKYSEEQLAKVLNIEKGDVYNTELLQQRLFSDPNYGDISSLYYDDGYLFFSANPVEVAVENDSIDLEIRINEGPQATIKNIIIEGNDKTNEHVIRRELRTLPGDKFSRTNLIRSQRELANLGFIDPNETQIVPIPNPQDGTVDIKYSVVEKSADQIELSAGWGGQNGGLIGTLGLKFNNFSVKNMFKKGTWSPLPTGDGQQFSVRVETNGKQYQNYNFSFTEPWLGGKKPNAFSVAVFRSRLQDVLNKEVRGRQITNGLSVGLGTRLKKPDDYFIMRASADYYGYQLNNFGGRYYVNNQPLTDGKFNNLNFTLNLQRNSIDQPVFPTSGSSVSLSLEFTPPYSLFKGKDYNYDALSDAERYKFVEYHKWKFNVDWYTSLGKSKFVLRTAAKFGFLGNYNKNLGTTPFERFEVGGNGIPSSVTLFGTDIIAQRGYEGPYSSNGGDPIYNKFVMELRYPFSLNPSATVYGILFAEGANTYKDIKNYNPFQLKKSVGFGIRAILPMFGLIGIDYGIRFDNANGSSIQNANGFFDYIGKNGNISFILGFEPE